jgi:hypothetical protein
MTNVILQVFIMLTLIAFITICIESIDNLWYKLTGKSFLYDVEYDNWKDV